MTLGPKPVPATGGRHETPSAGINWKLFLLVAGIIGVAFFAGMIMQSDGNSANLADADSSGVDIGQDVEPNSPPVAVETETPDAESGLRLLKKEGPFVFPDQDGRTEMGSIIPQKTEFEVNKFQVYVAASSEQEPTSRIKPLGFHSGGEKFIVLVLLRDEYGNVEKSFCKVDKETGSYYYSKLDFSYGVPEYATPLREGMVSEVHSWEVLVYG